MSAVQQVLLAVGALVDKVFMDFEGTDGTQVFTDSGTGASSWTALDANATLSNAVPLAGSTSLRLTTATTGITTPYSSANGLPASAPWSIKFRLRSTDWNSGGIGRYILSAQDSSATAAGTAFAIATNASAGLNVVLSDGSTRSVVITYAGPLATNTTYDFEISRSGSTVSLKINGSVVATGTFSGNVNMPAGRALRVGKPEASASAANTFYFDIFRISA